jgi:NAD(P)-dependent dehydrogenase (short-subunit alcohol dehydrogenase family)
MRHYLVVGGTKGIGKALVERLDEANASITVLAREIGDHRPASSRTYLQCDVLSDVLPNIDHELHGIAYCPGTINLKPFERLTDDDFRRDIETNLIGAVKVIRNYLNNLREAESSSIVLFSTVAAGVGMGFHASVASAKAAVEGLARSLAAEFAPKIRVNCVAPSLTITPLSEKLTNSPDKIEASAARHPLRRIGTPEEVAGIAEFLLSERSGWITGQVIHIDGGLSSVR